jgi:hypothetical protein
MKDEAHPEVRFVRIQHTRSQLTYGYFLGIPPMRSFAVYDAEAALNTGHGNDNSLATVDNQWWCLNLSLKGATWSAGVCPSLLRVALES